MPDQHSAATEHELISTISEPLGHLPEDPLAVISADFPIALRGYDRIAVDAYVEHTTELIAELQSTRSPEAAVRRALQRVGEEISGILQRAHETADEITARSRSEAETRLETARREAVELTADAERRVAELDVETERIWAERHRIVVDARQLASRLTELAETALERFPAAGGADAGGTGEPASPPPPGRPFDGAEELDAESAAEAERAAETASETAVTEPVAADWAESGAGAWAEPDAGAEAIEQPTELMPPLLPWEDEEPGSFDPARP